MGLYAYMLAMSIYVAIRDMMLNEILWVIIIAEIGLILFSYFVINITLEDIKEGYIVCDIAEIVSRTAYMLTIIGFLEVCGLTAYIAIAYRVPQDILLMISFLFAQIIIDVKLIIIPEAVGWFMRRKMRHTKILGIACIDICHVAALCISLGNIKNLDILDEKWSEISHILRIISSHDDEIRRNVERLHMIIRIAKTEKHRDKIELVKREIAKHYGWEWGFVLLNIVFTIVVADTLISSNISRYISIPITVFSITIFLGAWVIVRKNKIIWNTSMTLYYKPYLRDIEGIIKQIREAGRELGESIIRFIAQELKLPIAVTNYKYSIPKEQTNPR